MKIDARGKACPTPVIMAKKAIENIDEGILTVLVDNFASKENVIRYAHSLGHSCEFTEKESIFTIDIAIGYPCDLPVNKQVTKDANDKNIVVYVSSDAIGDNNGLGEELMKGFIGNIINMDLLPKTIIFVNTGINLTTLNHDTVTALNILAEKKIEILSCGACLTHLNLEHDLQVGEVTDHLHSRWLEESP